MECLNLFYIIRWSHWQGIHLQFFNLKINKQIKRWNRGKKISETVISSKGLSNNYLNQYTLGISAQKLLFRVAKKRPLLPL